METTAQTLTEVKRAYLATLAEELNAKFIKGQCMYPEITYSVTARRIGQMTDEQVLALGEARR